jgi:heme/copper-type cytochrome/quinol oxidase subunit 2
MLGSIPLLFPVAQWDPMDMVFHLLVAVGLLLLVVFLVLLTLAIARRKSHAEITCLPVALVATAIPLLIVVFLVFSILKSFSTKPWTKTRTATIQAVDATTGTSLPIEGDFDQSVAQAEDPFGESGFGPPSTPDGRLNEMLLKANWTANLPITVTSKGYEKISLQLNDQSPELIVVHLHKIAEK